MMMRTSPTRAPSGARSGCGRSFARLSKATRRDQEAACDDARTRRDVFLSLTAGFLGIGACSGEDGLLRSIAIAAAEEELLPVKSLPKGAKQTQTQEVLDLIKDGVKMHVTEDYRSCLQLALLDALSYDKDAKSGGANGSIANFPEELKALGLEGSLKTAVDQIRKAKEHAEKASAFPLELSMADAIVFAAYYKVRSNFIGQIVDKAKDQTSANIILQGYGNDFPPPPLGRLDATAPDAAAPTLTTAALVDRALAAGLTAGNVSALAACFPTGGLEEVENEMRETSSKFKFYVKSNQQSRETVTQTNYQIDFSNAFSKLSTLGAKFDVERYYHPIPKQGLPKKL